LIKNVQNKKKCLYPRILLAFIFIIFFVFGTIFYLYPVKYSDIINKYSQKYNLPPELVYAIINTESGFDENEISSKGARGLMQIMKETADWAASKENIENYSYENITSPELNIHIGCWYISWLNKNFSKEKKVVLAAYNAGNGNIQKWLSNPEYSKDGKTLCSIPFKETENYIRKVTSAERFYKYILKLPFIG